jgi:hypothetical protein
VRLTQKHTGRGRVGQLYMRGCSFADSRVGDDLPGLVFNWYGGSRTLHSKLFEAIHANLDSEHLDARRGVGLYSMAQHVKAPEAALSHLVSSVRST